jgi:hypothetical protein
MVDHVDVAQPTVSPEEPKRLENPRTQEERQKPARQKPMFFVFVATPMHQCDQCGRIISVHPCVACTARSTPAEPLAEVPGPDPIEWPDVARIVAEDAPKRWPEEEPPEYVPYDWDGYEEEEVPAKAK